MLFDQRIIFSDNGVLTDYSNELNNYSENTALINYTAGQDYLYIGTFLPFNHRYIDISTANNLNASLQIEVWDGKSFNSAVDILDFTRDGAVSFAKDGFIRWSRNRDKVWNRELDSFNVTGLGNTNITGLFWLRMSWSASLAGTTALKYIGHKFSKDLQLFNYYPDLNNTDLMSAFSAGKTSWEDQHYIAAEQIITDLRRKNVIQSGDQILDYELFIEPSVHKVAELIYTGLGSAFEDKRKNAETKYITTLDLGYVRIDLDQDSNLSTHERYARTGFLTR